MGQETTERRQLCDTASGYQHILSGRLIPIGVASPKRIAGFNTVPALAEQGLKGFEAYAWQGLVVWIADTTWLRYLPQHMWPQCVLEGSRVTLHRARRVADSDFCESLPE